MPRFIAFGVLLSIITLQSPSLAQPQRQGTNEEQDACRPDTLKLCREAVPDTFRVLACLQANRANLSNRCRAVLASHGQ